VGERYHDPEFGRRDRLGTNHEGLGPLQDGELAEIEITGIGRMAVNVTDPLKREWERGIYMGENSTHPDAVAAARAKADD